MFSRISLLIRQQVESYRSAKESGDLPFWFISLMAIYIPFEDFIIAWLPVPLTLKSAVRFLPEVVLYTILFRIGFQRFKANQPIQTTPIDIVVIAFFMASAVSIVVNDASLPGSIDNLRTNWRYLAVYYILVNINISQQQITHILNRIKIAGLIQAGLASIQFFMPSSVKVALAAGGCNKAIGKGASCGTFLDSALLSGFLLVTISLLFSSIYINSTDLLPQLKDLIAVLVTYFGLFASKKRAAMLVALIIPILVLMLLARKRKATILVWMNTTIATLLLPLFPLLTADVQVSQYGASDGPADNTSYFFTIFSKEYWQHNLEASRGWFVITVVRTVLITGSWFGLGPELGSVMRNISQFLSHPADIAQLQRDIYVFDDPYWFAILGYFGIVGVLLYWLVIFRLYQAARSLVKTATCREDKVLGVTASTIFVIGFFYAFAERLFRLRSFSFYFWLFAGLVVNLYLTQNKSEQSMVKPSEITE